MIQKGTKLQNPLLRVFQGVVKRLGGAEPIGRAIEYDGKQRGQQRTAGVRADLD
ncbi:MAG: hypothetical protein ETSY1_08930 [Candidatus Entotheonella factor]|uniref:Uncharacterized protein n=1 Tax=Entotheonella factor TaxID=1429438 RepID=W4LTK9_ENTF1|nr:MAG: hypothetical protein ETSY1_08930 [Candidatus Entotheonella factor]